MIPHLPPPDDSSPDRDTWKERAELLLMLILIAVCTYLVIHAL